ncbi:MAG: hypothetical protein V2I33_19480 [Kangiellaceae bacterium]|jgi:hypothetical protein|nr:hypothetical protein [Kangiellaceae bacterium]
MEATTVLLEKPEIIARAGYRRTINEGILFTQREYYLAAKGHPLEYGKVLADHQYFHNMLEEWKLFEIDMMYKQQQLLDSNAIISDGHYDLIHDTA